MRTDRLPYRTLEEVLHLVRNALGVQGVTSITVEPGVVCVNRKEGVADGTPIDPFPPLPGDDLLERIRVAGADFGVGYISALTVRDALMVALAFLHRHRLYPTHFLCRSYSDLLSALSVEASDSGGLMDGRTLFGWEVVVNPEVEEGTLFLCAGPRRGGGVSDVRAAVRLLEEGS